MQAQSRYHLQKASWLSQRSVLRFRLFRKLAETTPETTKRVPCLASTSWGTYSEHHTGGVAGCRSAQNLCGEGLEMRGDTWLDNCQEDKGSLGSTLTLLQP